MRYIENWLAGLGGLLASAYVALVEILPHSGLTSCVIPTHAHPGVPWGVVILVTAMVIPKTLGRRTGGAVWTSLANRLPGRRPSEPAGKVDP